MGKLGGRVKQGKFMRMTPAQIEWLRQGTADKPAAAVIECLN